jgi:hypothetical protein
MLLLLRLITPLSLLLYTAACHVRFDQRRPPLQLLLRLRRVCLLYELLLKF